MPVSVEETNGKRILNVLVVGHDVNAMPTELGDVINDFLLTCIFSDSTNHVCGT